MGVPVKVEDEVAVGVGADDTAFGIDEEGQEELGDSYRGLFEELRVLEGYGTSVGGDGWFAHLAEEGKSVCLSCALCFDLRYPEKKLFQQECM